MTLWPRTLLWRSVLLIAFLLALAHATWLWIFQVSEREPRDFEARQRSRHIGVTSGGRDHSDVAAWRGYKNHRGVGKRAFEKGSGGHYVKSRGARIEKPFANLTIVVREAGEAA